MSSHEEGSDGNGPRGGSGHGAPEVRPPRWAEALLSRTLPDGIRGASIRADLDVEFQEWCDRSGRGVARRRYAWEAVKIATHFAWGAARSRRTDRMTGGGVMDRLKWNVRFAARQLVRAPIFAVTAVVTIALGIGANVTIFSVVDAVLLEPLPYDEPDELVAVWEWNVPRDRRENVANPGNFSAWRDRSEAFESMTAVSMAQPATVMSRGEPDEAMVQYASPDFFAVLGLEAALGRTFTRESSASEATEGVISDRYWRERFGGDPGVVGSTVQVNGTPVVIVGVLPDDYMVFGDGTGLWASVDVDQGDQTNSGRWLMVVGRLADGVALEAADDELKAISASLEDEFPEFNAGWSVRLVPLEEQVVGNVEATLWMLLAAVGMLLLIAAANVANLFLVRATERQKEMAVRTSLGASGSALAGQLLTESLLIAVLGAGVGVAGASAVISWMATGLPDVLALPRIAGASIDGRVLVFAGSVTAGTALLFGLLPAVKAAHTAPAETLGSESRGASRRTHVARDVLVVTEVALSLVLLAGAGLFVRSFQALMAVDDGIEGDQVLVGRVNLAGDAYEGDARKVAFFDELMGRLSTAPGVEAVGGVTFLPMDGLGAGTSYWLADRPTPEPDDRPAADIRNVAGDYFGAMGIELLQGRSFDARDRDDAPQTVVVNRALARKYWPDESPIGKRLIVNWLDDTPWEIIGVVEDVRLVGPSEAPRETIYIHYAKATFLPWLHVTVRATGEPGRVANLVRRELAALDNTLPLGSVRVMSEIVGRSVAQPRMTSLIMLLFAGVATILAAVGLYGVLAYAVSRRVREIGVRVALGAEPGRVVRMIVTQGTRLVVLGLLLGLGAALVANRLIASLLYGVSPTDSLSFLAAVAVLSVVALLACAIPAARAVRVPPSEALRPD